MNRSGALARTSIRRRTAEATRASIDARRAVDADSWISTDAAFTMSGLDLLTRSEAGDGHAADEIFRRNINRLNRHINR